MEGTADRAFPLRKYFSLPDTFSEGYSCHSLPRKTPRCKDVRACFWKKLRCSMKNLERRLFLLYGVHWIVGLPPVYLLIKNSILQRLLRQELQSILEIYKQKLHTRSYSYTSKSPLRILHPTSLKQISDSELPYNHSKLDKTPVVIVQFDYKFQKIHRSPTDLR